MAATLAGSCSLCARAATVNRRSFSGATKPLPVLHRQQQAASSVCRMKKDIHPEYFEDAKVYCNGEEVLTTSGTQKSYTVDIWSGNHPFFSGNSNNVILDEGRVNRFKRRYDGLEAMSDMSTMAAGEGKGVDIAAWKKQRDAVKANKIKGKKRK